VVRNPRASAASPSRSGLFPLADGPGRRLPYAMGGGAKSATPFS
jgi:hypothetical protein